MSRYDPELHTALADFHAILAASFATPPLDEDFLRAMQEDLVSDFHELSRVIPWLDPQDIDAFASSMAAVNSPLELLQLYSGLFLVPPQAVSLNAGLYLDGMLMGKAWESLRDAYAREGFVRAEDFRDLDDHLGLILQFAVWLHQKAAGDPEAHEEAEDFNRAYLQTWLPTLTRRLGEEGERRHRDLPYAHLAKMAKAVVWRGEEPLAGADDADQSRAGQSGRRVDELPQQVCRSCGRAYLPSDEILSMKRILAKRGVSVDHLDACPDCRIGELGYEALRPPTIERHGRRIEG